MRRRDAFGRWRGMLARERHRLCEWARGGKRWFGGAPRFRYRVVCDATRVSASLRHASAGWQRLGLCRALLVQALSTESTARRHHMTWRQGSRLTCCDHVEPPICCAHCGARLPPASCGMRQCLPTVTANNRNCIPLTSPMSWGSLCCPPHLILVARSARELWTEVAV